MTLPPIWIFELKQRDGFRAFAHGGHHCTLCRAGSLRAAPQPMPLANGLDSAGRCCEYRECRLVAYGNGSMSLSGSPAAYVRNHSGSAPIFVVACNGPMN